MNALTVQSIQTIGTQVHPESVVHETTIAYVQNLLYPYAEAIEEAHSIDSVRNWIPMALPGELSQHATSELIKESQSGDLEAVKLAVIEYLIAEILELAGSAAGSASDMTILPWDVQRSIGFDPELSILVGIRNDSQTLRNGEPRLLPVVINGHTHYLSQDFVAGLLLFSSIITHDFGIMMFGTPFNANYMQGDNRYTSGQESEYIVTIMNNHYNFNSLDFMQGFMTGAEWTGVDHHKYWSDLMQITESGDMIEITL